MYVICIYIGTVKYLRLLAQAICGSIDGLLIGGIKY